jgi:phosphatidylglycerophosphate synthase
MRQSLSIREEVASRGKAIADILTTSRFFLAFIILVCALPGNPDLLSLVVALVVLGWTTDVLDGYFARSDVEGRKTWIGDHDFLADEAIRYAPMIYFMTAGYLPFLPFMFYGVFVAFVAFKWMNEGYQMAVGAPVTAMPLIIAFVHAPLMGWIFLAWIVLALVFNWKRFTRVVERFTSNVENKPLQ